jgi:hypothetical protein
MAEANFKPVTARESVANYLLEQVLGPTKLSMNVGSPLPEAGEDGKVHLSKEDAEGPFYDPITGYPLLKNTRPKMVYGTGVLHAPRPLGYETEDETPDVDEPLDSAPAPFEAPEAPDQKFDYAENAEEEVSSIDQSQKIRPSAMGMTAQFVILGPAMLKIKISGATYEEVKVQKDNSIDVVWFKRIAHDASLEIPWREIEGAPNQLRRFPIPGPIGELASLQLRWRPTSSTDVSGADLKAITAVVAHNKSDEDLFQFQLKLSLEGDARFASVDKTKNYERSSFEDQEIELLYRHVNSYAYGHGIAVSWGSDLSEPIREVWTESIPVFFQELPETNIDGLKINMSTMADGDSEEIRGQLQSLIDGYKNWIEEQTSMISNLPEHQQVIAKRLVTKSDHILQRMQQGLKVLFDTSNPNVLQAFRLANRAMRLQQQRGQIKLRTFEDVKGEKISFEPIELPDPNTYGTWRPFQIGFILMTLPGIVDPLDTHREEVDLIFFPTGGGKTEAYLGAAAIQIALRRLEDNSHEGVDVLMRYTLRLLTVQQFERTSGLIVSLEHLRRLDPTTLGETPISIGVWLGDNTTPNKRSKALAELEGKGSKDDASHPFVLNRCPWCSAQFAVRKSTNKWVGYKKSTEEPATLRFVCGDTECEFSRESTALPIWITDEDVYEKKPSFVLGTVDKFAQLSWEPRSRALFNIGPNGDRIGLPPGLIIQDELHLISGPLGSLVGLYEAVIEELCSYEIEGKRAVPKIIASTATTRRYEAQILHLYSRDRVTLFPQAISRANDTYFSRVKMENGVPVRGTQYVGINPATYATGQLASSQVSAFLSQAPSAWEGSQDEIDYYSTSMWFFNSLKELGQTLTLLQSTVVSLLNSMWRDGRISNNKTRYLDPIMELTGRVSSAEVSKALGLLNIPASKSGSVRTCLASSIMEVGVDVSRLGLLTINSQPKLTAQYIQVSGRVGRKPELGPGLVVMLYNSSRARDRSVYEHFEVFHKRLYAQVEPLSVTPFAIQTMAKGLPGAMIAMYRMLSPITEAPTHPNQDRLDLVVSVFKQRLAAIGSSENQILDFEKQVNEFWAYWLAYEPTNWVYEYKQYDPTTDNPSTALLRRRPEVLSHIPGENSIEIPQSMRSVDGQTRIQTAANVYSFASKHGLEADNVQE